MESLVSIEDGTRYHFGSIEVHEFEIDSTITPTMKIFCTVISPPPVDFVFRFRYRLRCLFETSQKNSAMGRHFFLQDKNDRKLHEDTCIFICKNLNNIMGLFSGNNTVTNF